VVGEPADDGSVTDELLIKLADGAEPGSLVERIESAGIPCTLLTRADAAELSDPVTTAIALARWMAVDPGETPRAIATLLRAQLVADDQAPGAGGAEAQIGSGFRHRLQTGGGTYELVRAWPFTATELSRVAAMLELGAQLRLRGGLRSEPEPVRRRIQLADGAEIVLRPARVADSALVAALHARCSPGSRRSRFLSPGPRLTPEELRQLVGDAESGGVAALALTTDEGSAVGLANLERSADGDGEFAVLVEDAWQGRGVATALVRRAVELAVEAGWAELTTVARPGELVMTRLLRRSGLRPSAQLVDGLIQIRAPLPLLRGVSRSG
jgi:GNAT superfamily N-acetyltransferase